MTSKTDGIRDRSEPLKWRPIGLDPEIWEASPSEDLRYFLVKQDDEWTACYTSGIRYKFSGTVTTETFRSLGDAQRFCEFHMCLSTQPNAGSAE